MCIRDSFKGALRDVAFADCKMTGADFTDIDRFSDGLVFENSHLDYATSHHAGKPNVSFFGIPGELSVLMRKSPQLMNVRLF